MGIGARALGMGGAFTGLANDVSAVFWNPAGLRQLGSTQIEFMNVNLPFDRTQNFLGVGIPLAGGVNLGAGWISLRVNGIEGRSGNTSYPDYVFSNSQNAFALSLSKSLGGFISFGGNFKFIYHQLDNFSASGLGADAAIMLHPFYGFKLGFMLQDIGTDLRWNAGYTEGIPMTYRGGASLRVFDGMVLAADISKTTNETPSLHVGGEFRPVGSIPIRVGVNDNQLTGGAGFDLDIAEHSLQLNYGYSNDRLMNDAIHRFSVLFAFGSKPSYFPDTSGPPSYRTPKKPKHATQTQAKTLFAVVTASILNVREGPGLQANRISQIERGQRFKAFDKKGEWQAIQLYDGRIGWVHRDYIEIVE